MHVVRVQRAAELALRLGVSADWIVSRTGIRERPMARPDERLADYAARAGAAALSRAGVDAADLDLVIAATMTQDQLTPNAGPVIALGDVEAADSRSVAQRDRLDEYSPAGVGNPQRQRHEPFRSRSVDHVEVALPRPSHNQPRIGDARRPSRAGRG